MRKFLIGLGVVVAIVAACAITGGTTTIIGRLIVQNGDTVPTCATATSDGDLCAADAIEAEGALDVAGTSTLTGAVTAAAGLSAGDSDITNVGDINVDSVSADGTTVDYMDADSLEIAGYGDIATTCTAGQIYMDTAGTTTELCFCQTANTWYCISVDNTSGPTD